MAELNSSQIELKNCLFCLDQIVKYEIRDDEGESTCAPNWKLICDYVIGKSSHVNSFCRYMESAECLCMDCYEMVVKLTKLHEEIEEVSLKIRCVIQPNESSLGTENVLRKSSRRPGRRQSSIADESKSDICKQLVDRFEDFVKQNRDVERGEALKDEEQEPESEITCTVENEGVKAEGKIKIERVKRNTVGPEVSLRSRKLKIRKNSRKPRKKAIKPELKIEVETVTANGLQETSQESLGHTDEVNNIVESELEAELDIPIEESKTTVRSDTEDEDWSPEDASLSKKRKNFNCTPASAVKRRRKERKGYTCIQCGKHFDDAKEYMVHRSEHRKVFDATFAEYFETVCEKSDDNNTQTFKKCKMCDYFSKTKGIKHLMEHMFSHEDDAPPTLGHNGEIINYPCNWCSDKFIMKINLEFHKMVAHDPSQMRLKCDVCSDVDYATREDLVDHLRIHTDKIHSCKSCPMSHTTLDRLLLHMVKHNPSKRLHCPECDVMPFNSIRKLFRHCAVVHRDLKQMFDCPKCDQSFVALQFLNEHIKKVHRTFDKNGETCPRCTDGQLFYTQEVLDKHIKKEHQCKSKRQFQCDQCEQTFGIARELKVHILKHHEGMRFLCPHCPKSYIERSSLDSHLKFHTGEGLLRCPECGKEFAKKGNLGKHMAVHEILPKDPICVCEICGKEFYSEAQLKRHIRVHKERKHECPDCNMKFNRHDHLRSHSRIHTGERPFECEVCKKGFNRKDIMRVHMKGVHGIIVKTKVYEYKKT